MFCWPARLFTSAWNRKRAYSSAMLFLAVLLDSGIVAVLAPTLARSVVALGLPLSPPACGIPLPRKMT